MSNPSSQGMSCPRCQTFVPSGNRFCGSCGYGPLDQQNTHITDVPAAPSTAPPVASASMPPMVEAATPATAKLVLLLPDGQEGGTYPLKPDLTKIGRKQGNILFLDDPYVSPIHATFKQNADGTLTVSDEQSLNGLFIRLKERTKLEHDSVILLGKQLLRFETVTPSSAEGSNQEQRWGSPYGPYWGRLVQLIAGGLVGNKVLLGGNQVDLGRERGQITFPGDRFISALHTRISFANGETHIEDLGSRNGTFKQLRSDHVLHQDDILIIGEQLLRVELASAL